MNSDTILSVVSLICSCTGFFLFLTVLLAAHSFLKAGTVGKMSVTFYSLASFNGCMWTVYGALLGSATIALPNAWSVVCTTFALFSYFRVLGMEVAVAKKKASNPPSRSDRTAIGDVDLSPIYPPVKPATLEDRATVITVVADPPAKTTVEEPEEDLTAVANELAERYAAAVKTAKTVLTINAVFVVIIVLSYAAGYQSASISIGGTMGVIMATLLFTGPLDQVSWIIKNNNSIPLDPLMTIVGTANAFMWAIFGFMTNDFFVYCPNIVAIILCILQLGLIVYYPRKAVVAV